GRRARAGCDASPVAGDGDLGAIELERVERDLVCVPLGAEERRHLVMRLAAERAERLLLAELDGLLHLADDRAHDEAAARDTHAPLEGGTQGDDALRRVPADRALAEPRPVGLDPRRTARLRKALEGAP